jgi:hypothetical protein
VISALNISRDYCYAEITEIRRDRREDFKSRQGLLFVQSRLECWSEGNPVSYLLKYIAFGEGDTAPVTHEVLRQAEKDPDQRPIVHVGG